MPRLPRSALSVRLLVVATAAALLSGLPATAAGGDITGPEPATSDLAETQERISASEYHVTWAERTALADVESALQAPNRAHGLRSYFLEKGLRVVPRSEVEPPWQWGLTLVGYGRDRHMVRPAKAALNAAQARVEYGRGELVEWYVNDRKGVEQGFTLSLPPDAAPAESGFVPGARRQETQGEAFLALTLEGSLAARISADGQTIDFAPRHGGMTVLHYGHLEVRDAAGRFLPSWIEGFAEAGVRGIRLVFDDRDAEYPVVVDPLLTSPAWTAEGGQSGAQLGYSVAGAGDVNGDGFDDVLVGAPYFDNGETDEGRAWLYYGSASGLESEAAWTGESDQAGGKYGWAVASAGDVNDDGFDDVIVGAPGYNFGADSDVEGRVWIYHGSASGLQPTSWSYETSSTFSIDDARFGEALAGAIDVNDDGFDDVLIGAPGAYQGQRNEGEVYLFLGSAAGLASSPDWSAEGCDAACGTEFSFGLALAGGDFNRDGFDDVVAAAYAGARRGRVLVFNGSAGVPSASYDQRIIGGEDWGVFGRSIAAGDFNGDGFDDLAVGSPYYGGATVNTPQDRGLVQVYHGTPLGLPTTPAWTGDGTEAIDVGETPDSQEFGWAVAVVDTNGDAYDDLLVGVQRYDNGGINEGRIYLYESSSSGGGLPPANVFTWKAEIDHFESRFGWSVASAGDVNGDGLDDVVAGAPFYTAGQQNEGFVAVYHAAPKVTGWRLADHLGFAPLEIASASYSVSSDGAALPAHEIPEAVNYGPIPESLLITTGRFVERDPSLGYPRRFTGVSDVDWGDDGQPDTTTYELELSVPPWAGSLRFTTQFVTNEVHDSDPPTTGDPFDTDEAKLRFRLNGWSVDEYPLNDPARWVSNAPVSHCLNVAGSSSVTLRFTVEDFDNSEDSGLILSRAFFSRLPFPPDITLDNDGIDADLDGVVDYFVNPSPSDLSLTAGTYTYTENLLTLPGIAMPFNFALVYNSQGDRAGIVGRKWTHSYLGSTEKIEKDTDKDGTPETLDAVMVRHGLGTAEYFEPDPVAGFAPKYPGIRNELREITSATCTDGTGTTSCDYYEMKTPAGMVYAFREIGDKSTIRLLRSVTDQNGNRFTLHYLEYGSANEKRVSRVVDTRGETACFHYSGAQLTGIDYQAGRSDCTQQSSQEPIWAATMAYDPATSDLASVTDLAGTTRNFTYDASGNLMAVIDDQGKTVVANSYEQFQAIDFLQTGDRVISRRGPLDPDPFDPDAGTLFAYDGESVRQTDKLGRVDVRYYDVRDRVARRIEPSGARFDFGYDHDGNSAETYRKLPSDPWPEPISYLVHDGDGHLLSRTDMPARCVAGPNLGAACEADSDCPDSSCGASRFMSYDIDGNVIGNSDPFGNSTTYSYDTGNRLVAATDPLGNSVAHTYRPDGRPASTIDTRGLVTSCEYDEPIPQPTRVYNPVDADGDGALDSVSYAYDELGRQTSVTDPNGNTSTSEYDGAGRLVAQTDALGNRTEYSYDAAGRPLSIRAPDGATTTSLYNDLGRLVAQTDPLGRVTHYDYDAEGRLSTVTDPYGRTVTYAYDVVGRSVGVTECGPGQSNCVQVTAEFDEVGNLIRLVGPGPDHWATTYEYDRLGRITKETDQLGNASTTIRNAAGQVVSSTNARGQTIGYEYDAAGRMTALRLAAGSITHTFDAAGNPVASMSNRYGNLMRGYDALDRVVEQTDEHGNTVRLAYDPAGNLTRLTYPDGSAVLYAYDPLLRLIRVEDWFDPGSPPDGNCEASGYCRVTAYAYDAVGNLISTNLPDASVISGSYDLAGRLTRLSDRNAGSQTILDAQYEYDAAGLRRVAELQLPLEPPVELTPEAMVHNELDQVVQRGAYSYGYDADGNLTSGFLDGSPRSLAYDELNQLVRFDGDTFRYDVDGMRIEANRSGTIRRYVYDPMGRLIEERDESGALVARYVHGNGLVSRAGPGGQEFRVYHYDSRGSTVALTDSNGSITDRYAYDPFGRLVGRADATSTPCDQGGACTENAFRYNGRDGVVDDGNGLYQLGVRYYAPELMRFIQRDGAPAGLSDTQSFNRYAYVKGNPVQFVDPDGNWFGIDDAVAIVGGAIVGAVGQAIECAVADDPDGQGCGWEDYVGAAAGGAAYGYTLLYTGNPVLAGAVGGAADATFTQGLKALPGGKDPLSTEAFLMDLGGQVAMGAAFGAFSKGPRVGTYKPRLNFKKRGLINTLAKKGTLNRHMKNALKAEMKGEIKKGILVKGGLGALKGGAMAQGVWDPYESARGEGGTDPRSGPVIGSVWNQQSSPHADAWASASSSGCIAHAWR